LKKRWCVDSGVRKGDLLRENVHSEGETQKYSRGKKVSRGDHRPPHDSPARNSVEKRMKIAYIGED